jgi:phosphatidylglycerol---prolipoprotein diacylglyceryl transferase
VCMFRIFPSREVAAEIFGFAVHWYGVMYLLAFVLAAVLIPHIQRYRNLHLSRDDWFTILSSSIVGVIVGGRLGYVFFYEPHYFAEYPEKIFAVWEGGMSSHGGFVGVALALFIISWQYDYNIRRLADVIVIPAALGLALGRLGNFINLELYGTVTDVPWAMAFPGAEGLRHPTQLYAMLKDITIAAVCFGHLWYTRNKTVPGRTFALFLAMYSTLRFVVEFYREQTYALVDFGFVELSRGQLLTLPLLLIAVLLWLWFKQEPDQTEWIDPLKRQGPWANS